MDLSSLLNPFRTRTRRRRSNSSLARSILQVRQLEDRITPTAPIPVGPQFQVNTTTLVDAPGLATDSSGNFVVAWKSWSSGHLDIFAQRYNAAGVPQGGEFQVNSFATVDGGLPPEPKVGMDAVGDFVIVWNDNPGGTAADDVFARRFNAAGVAQGAEFRVNTITGGQQRLVGVGMDAAGNFTVGWFDTSTIYCNRYDPQGDLQGQPIAVSPPNAFSGIFNLAMEPSGRFVVTWLTVGVGLSARWFDAYGQPLGPQVLTPSGNFHGIAIDSAGNAVVTWLNSGALYAQRFAAPGTPVSPVFQINSAPCAYYPHIAYDAVGNFVVCWYTGNSSNLVYARAFNSDGTPRGPEFLVVTSANAIESNPVIAVSPSGPFIIAWAHNDGSGIFAQRYRPGVPQVQSTQVDDGAAQRSRVSELTVTFDSEVNFVGAVGSAFTLVRNGGSAVSFDASTAIIDGLTVITLSNFTGASTQFGSLIDGRYTLTVLASQVTDDYGQHLDGDGDLQQGGNYTFGDAQGLFRFFGDVNGDRTVNGLDLGFFRNAFGTQAGDANYLSYLDFDGDGVINGFDLGQFRTRFGTMLP